LGADPNELVPVPRRIETLFVPKLVTAKSKFMSPLKSPTETDLGPVPTAKLGAAPNGLVPVPKRIEMLKRSYHIRVLKRF